MMGILAQATMDAGQVGIWLGCGVAVIAGVNQALKFTDRFREQPPAHERYATKAELEEVRGDIDDMREEIKVNYNKIMESSADGRRRLYKEMNDIAAAVHRIEGHLAK